MIRVQPINKDYYEGFTMKGHAEYASNGHDIVCAGVSGALFTTYHALSYHLKEDEGMTVIMRNGYAKVQIELGTLYTDSIIDAFLDTLEAIQKKYPNTIAIEGDANHEARIPTRTGNV